MINLHKLHGEPLVLNAELIQTVEATPDTLITLVDRRRMIVSESVEDVIDLVLAYRRRVLAPALAMASLPG